VTIFVTIFYIISLYY